MFVVLILTRLSGPCTVSASVGGGPNDASPMSRSLLVSGTLSSSGALSRADSLGVNPSTCSVPLGVTLLVCGFLPSFGGSDLPLVTGAASCVSLVTGVSGPAATCFFAMDVSLIYSIGAATPLLRGGIIADPNPASTRVSIATSLDACLHPQWDGGDWNVASI